MSAEEKDEARERAEDEPEAEDAGSDEGAEDAADDDGSGEDAEHSDDDDDSDSDDASSDTAEKVDVSDTTAPSIGPDTVIEREDPEDRLARHDQSDVDAMGLDKRRPVIGGQFGASRTRQATIYGIFLAVVAALVIGGLLLVNELDQPPADNPDAAPWAENKIEAKELQ